MKYRLKGTASVLIHNGKEYGPGDKVELSKEEAVRMAHHLEQEVELVGEPKPKQKEADDPENLK